MKRRSLAVLLAMSVFASAVPVSIQAEDLMMEESVAEEVFEESDIDEMLVEDGDITLEEDVVLAEEVMLEQGEEETTDLEENEIFLEQEEETTEVMLDEEALLRMLNEEAEAETDIALKQATIGSSTYAFVNLTDTQDKENRVYTLTVQGRGGATVTNYSFTDLKQLEGTEYYYIVTAGSDLIGETVYAYTGNTTSSQTYSQLYSSLGVDTSTSDYDAISSATNYTGYHAKDISGTVIYGTNGSGNKVITGVATGREMKAVDGTAYVTAKILAADGGELTEEQELLIQNNLKKNPTSGATGTKSVALASATYTTSRYGIGEFAIVPDDSVSGYVWSEYWDNVYGATISNGATTAGAVHWIDLYGEAATSGPHYNKIELALNSGTAVASNAAFVNRYDAFIEDGALKPGKYTITVYADGYENLTATVINVGESSISLADKTVAYTGEAVEMSDAVSESGSSSEVILKYYADEACTEELTEAPVEAGTYYVTASVGADELYSAATSNVATLTINKAKSTITLKAATTTYTGKAQTIAKASVKGSTGAVKYTYYTDAACTKAIKTTPVNAGTYYVKATLAENANYAGATSTAVKFVINKAASTVTLKAATTTYTGKARSIGKATVKGSDGKVTYTYYSDAACTKALKSAPVNAGTYYVKAKVAANTNYNAATSKAVKLVIAKKASTIKVKTSSATYKVADVKKAAKGFSMGTSVDSKGKLTYKKVSGSASLTVDKNGKVTLAKKAKKGTYTIKVRITSAATANYKAATKDVTIKVVVK